MYHGQDDYSDSCDNSFIYDSELDDDAHYFNDQENIYIKYRRYVIDGNILEAEEELHDINII